MSHLMFGDIRFAESVTRGHPDKVADQISDALVDAHLREDPTSRVAVETLIKSDMVCLSGEITSRGRPDVDRIVRETLANIGYAGLADQVKLVQSITRQSPSIDSAVTGGGAGDQAVVVGHAVRNQLTDHMPIEIALANLITSGLTARAARDGTILPDGKVLVVIDDGSRWSGGVFLRRVTCSAAHRDGTDPSRAIRNIIEDACRALNVIVDPDTRFLINPPYGRFVASGPSVDAGVTGRKIVMDTYGPMVPHGGGAFSGKDPSKIDRSGAYLARAIAKHLVWADIAESCTVYLDYAFGMPDPRGIRIIGASKWPEFCRDGVFIEEIADAVFGAFDCSARGMVSELGLTQFENYSHTAQNGHFGTHQLEYPRIAMSRHGTETFDPVAPIRSDFPWERMSDARVIQLKKF